MDQHANARKVYFAAIFSFMAAVEVAFCAWFGLHHHAQLAGSLAGTAFLLGAAGIAVSGIVAVGAHLREGLSKAVMGLVIVFFLTIFFLLMTVAEIFRR